MNAHCFSFFPDRVRVEAVDLAIRHSLIESVDQILREMRHAGIAYEGDFNAWRSSLAKLQGAPPLLWACYHDLVQAVARGDESAITKSANELLSFEPMERLPENVITLSGPYLTESNIQRYRNIIDDDPDVPHALKAVPPEEVARIRHLLSAARSLMLDACPALWAEIEVLGHQIVLVSPGAGADTFGGAASIFLWGAVILNPTRLPDRITLVESLVHETAHALLFGFTSGENLTLNNAKERYASPLRPDPRPIEGIVHATFVLARMIYALDLIAQSNLLNAPERATLGERRGCHVRGFSAGLEIVMAHAVFTPEGERIFSACAAAMAERKTGARAFLANVAARLKNRTGKARSQRPGAR